MLSPYRSSFRSFCSPQYRSRYYASSKVEFVLCQSACCGETRPLIINYLVIISSSDACVIFDQQQQQNICQKLIVAHHLKKKRSTRPEKKCYYAHALRDGRGHARGNVTTITQFPQKCTMYYVGLH